MKAKSKSRKKALRPLKAWAVLNSARRPYLESIRATKGAAIDAYITPRGYLWSCCEDEDGATCQPVLITVLKP